MKTFQTINQAVRFISSHANTGKETTLNDCICFGMGVYAYTSECKKAGIETANNASAFVPVSIARQVSEAANALGLHVCGGIHREDTNDIALYIA